MTSDPFQISIIVVCYNERSNIDECINSLLMQNYPIEDYEIIIVDNNSTDGTEELVKKYPDDRLRLLNNPIKGIAGSRNIGIDNARFDYVAFIDADCIAPRNWLAGLADKYSSYVLSNNRLVAVGGSNVPPDTSIFYRSLRIMLKTFFGSRGSVQGMVFQNDRSVEHLPCVNVLYKKDKIVEIGKFDEKFRDIGEDADLTFRLKEKGYQFMYLAGEVVIHKLRSNYFRWAKNMFKYGKGRIWLIKKHKKMFSVLFLIPALLVMLLALSVFIKIARILWVYFALIFIVSFLNALKGKKPHLTFHLFFLYLTTHIFYGLGEIYGFFVNPK